MTPTAHTRLAEALAEYDRYPGVAADRLAEAARAIVASADAGREGAIEPAGWFSYDPGDYFQTHDTESAAKSAAEAAFSHYREASVDGWDEDVEQVCYGRIVGKVVRTETLTRQQYEARFDEPLDAAFDEAWDYGLVAALPPWSQPEAPKPAEVERAKPQAAEWFRSNGDAVRRYGPTHFAATVSENGQGTDWYRGWNVWGGGKHIASGPETGDLGRTLADICLAAHGYLAWGRVFWSQDAQGAALRELRALTAMDDGPPWRGLTPATLDRVLAAVREVPRG